MCLSNKTNTLYIALATCCFDRISDKNSFRRMGLSWLTSGGYAVPHGREPDHEGSSAWGSRAIKQWSYLLHPQEAEPSVLVLCSDPPVFNPGPAPIEGCQSQQGELPVTVKPHCKHASNSTQRFILRCYHPEMILSPVKLTTKINRHKSALVGLKTKDTALKP